MTWLLWDSIPSATTSKYLHHRQTQHRVIIPFVNSSTDEWCICWTLIDKSSLTWKFWAVLIHSSYSVIGALFTGWWLNLILYLLIHKTGLAQCKVFDRPCPHQWLKDLYYFYYWSTISGYDGVPLTLVFCSYLNAIHGI